MKASPDPSGVYFFDKLSVLNRFLYEIDPEHIYTNLDHHEYYDRTIFFGSNSSSTLKMLTTIYNELYNETYDFLEEYLQQLQEQELSPVQLLKETQDLMTLKDPHFLGSTHFTFHLAESRKKMPNPQHHLLLLRLHLNYLEDPTLSRLFYELLKNAEAYHLSIFVLSYLPFHWLPDRFTKMVQYYPFDHTIHPQVLMNRFEISNPDFLQRNISQMQPEDLLIFRQDEKSTQLKYRFLPFPRAEEIDLYLDQLEVTL